MGYNFTNNPTNLAELLEVERILKDVFPQRMQAILQTGDTKKAAKCKKEFDALQNEFNKALCYENCDGTFPVARMIQANAKVNCEGGKKNPAHAKLAKEANKLAERWGHSQAFKAAPALEWEYLHPERKEEVPRMGFKAAPSSKWAFW